jgi:hypothetical protein
VISKLPVPAVSGTTIETRTKPLCSDPMVISLVPMSGWSHPERPGRRIRTSQPHELHDDSSVVLSYGDYFSQYRMHPETKATDPNDGKTCHTWTRGLLQPQHVRATGLLRVGKESNRLADTEQTVDDPEEQAIEYPMPSRRCRGCDTTVHGRRHWCSEACRKARWRSRCR